MASNQKKNRKFGRHRASDRRCKPSTKRYHSEERWKFNKIKKLRKHCKAHPNDKRNASALTTVTALKAGPAATYPYPPLPITHKLDLSDLELEYREHHTEGSGKKKKVVLHELVSTKPIYCVESCGVTQERTVDLEAAEQFFADRYGACALVERTGAKVKVLKNKAAIPPRGFETQFRKSFYEHWQGRNA